MERTARSGLAARLLGWLEQIDDLRKRMGERSAAGPLGGGSLRLLKAAKEFAASDHALVNQSIHQERTYPDVPRKQPRRLVVHGCPPSALPSKRQLNQTPAPSGCPHHPDGNPPPRLTAEITCTGYTLSFTLLFTILL